MSEFLNPYGVILLILLSLNIMIRVSTVTMEPSLEKVSISILLRWWYLLPKIRRRIKFEWGLGWWCRSTNTLTEIIMMFRAFVRLPRCTFIIYIFYNNTWGPRKLRIRRFFLFLRRRPIFKIRVYFFTFLHRTFMMSLTRLIIFKALALKPSTNFIFMLLYPISYKY